MEVRDEQDDGGSGGDDDALRPVQGGPYDDDAFLSGWRLAELASMLGRPEVRHLCECIRPGERHQADLIAMARGYTMNVDGRVGGDWLSVTFERTTDDL